MCSGVSIGWMLEEAAEEERAPPSVSIIDSDDDMIHLENNIIPTEAVKKVFSLYHNHGNDHYIGEDGVTILQHSIKSAHVAEREVNRIGRRFTNNFRKLIVLGMFLHDIGHLVGMANGLPKMDEYGTRDHEHVGADFLESLGFPRPVCDIARHHVDAKRYKVGKDARERSKLSKASQETLDRQGGPMTADEIAAFEKDRMAWVYLRCREWEDEAKVPPTPEDLLIRPLQYYESLALCVLCNRYDLAAAKSKAFGCKDDCGNRK